MERAVDIVANHLDLDPAVVRFRNMIPPEAMLDVGLTYRDGVPMVYDSGDYLKLDARWMPWRLDVIRKRQKDAWADGKYLGPDLVVMWKTALVLRRGDCKIDQRENHGGYCACPLGYDMRPCSPSSQPICGMFL